MKNRFVRTLAVALLSMAMFAVVETLQPRLVSAAGLHAATPALLWTSGGMLLVSMGASGLLLVSRLRTAPGRAAIPLLVNLATLVWLISAA